MMKPFLSLLAALAALALADGATCAEDNKLPADALDILRKAEQFVVVSLDPSSEKEPVKNGFHGFKELGRTTVKDAATRKQLVDALVKGMEGKIDPAKCFIPRHGIVAMHEGKAVELVICFECAQFRLYAPDGTKHLLVGKSPEPVFDKVLSDAKIPKAK